MPDDDAAQLRAGSRHEAPGADLDWSDWNDLRVITEDRAREAAALLSSRASRYFARTAQKRWQRADRLRQKVNRAFYRASEDH